MYNNGNSATGNRAVSKLLVVLLSVAICAAFMPLLSDSADAAAKKPGKVKKVTVTVNKKTNKVSVKWKKAKKAKKYEVRVTDGSSKLVASKKTKKKSFSFNGHAHTKYTVKVRGIRGKKFGKWSKKKSVTTGKSSGQTNSEKALADAKAALEQAQKELTDAQKELKDAQDALEQAKKDHDADQQTIADLEQDVKDLEDLVDEKNEEVAEAQTVTEIVKAIKDGERDHDKILALRDAYYGLSDEAKATVPADVAKALIDKADFIDRQRANAFLVDAVRLSAGEILDDCDAWGPEEYNRYANRVEKAIDTFDNDLTINQQLLVGLEIRDRLSACEFALEKAAAILGLNQDYNAWYLRHNYYKDEREVISEILEGEYEGTELVEKGAIDLIKEAETSNDIYEIVNEANDAIAKVNTKPQVVTAMINHLSPKYDEITAENVSDAVDDIAAIEQKYNGSAEPRTRGLSWDQKKEVENLDLFTAVDNRLSAYLLTKDSSIEKAKADAKEAIAYGLAVDDYFDDGWNEIKAIIADGKAAIDAAATIEEVNAATADAFDKIDAVPAKVKVVRAMVEDLVENYLDNLDDENIDEARDAAADVEDAYDNDLNESQQAQLFAENDGLKRAVFKLIRQLDNYDLNKAKYDATAELEAIYAYEDMFYQRPWEEVCGEIENGIAAIEAVRLPKDPTIKDVEEAIAAVEKIVIDTEAAIEEIPTKPEVVTWRISKLYDHYLAEGVDEFVVEKAEELREMYEELTADQQEDVENIDRLETVENAIERIRETEVADIEKKIDAINDLEDVVKGRNIVFAATEAYFNADEAVQALVTNADVLEAALDEIDVVWPERISAEILALYDAVDDFDDMDEDEQKEFLDKLDAVQDELEEYDAAREPAGVNNRVVKKYRQMLTYVEDEVVGVKAELIKGMIAYLEPVLDFNTATKIDLIKEAFDDAEEAREAYDESSKAVKALVGDDIEDLEAVEELLENLKAALEIKARIGGLDYVQDLELEEGNKEAIAKAVIAVKATRKAFDELDEDVQDLVDDETVAALELAEAKIEALKIEAMTSELKDPNAVTIADKEDIDEVIGEYVANYDAVKQFIGKDSDVYTKLVNCGAALLNAMTEPLMGVDPAYATEYRTDIEAAVSEYKNMPGAVQKAFKAEPYKAAYNHLKALYNALPPVQDGE